jgi:outer membrane scaffolding protein for murein synthesis (MipA/OmpV family)
MLGPRGVVPVHNQISKEMSRGNCSKTVEKVRKTSGLRKVDEKRFKNLPRFFEEVFSTFYVVFSKKRATMAHNRVFELRIAIFKQRHKFRTEKEAINEPDR